LANTYNAQAQRAFSAGQAELQRNWQTEQAHRERKLQKDANIWGAVSDVVEAGASAAGMYYGMGAGTGAPVATAGPPIIGGG